MTREEAIQILADLIESPFLHTWEKQNKALHMAIEALKADAVEVVRCKDCKWREHIGCALSIADDSDKPKDNDFCSYGERREE